MPVPPGLRPPRQQNPSCWNQLHLSLNPNFECRNTRSRKLCFPSYAPLLAALWLNLVSVSPSTSWLCTGGDTLDHLGRGQQPGRIQVLFKPSSAEAARPECWALQGSECLHQPWQSHSDCPQQTVAASALAVAALISPNCTNQRGHPTQGLQRPNPGRSCLVLPSWDVFSLQFLPGKSQFVGNVSLCLSWKSGLGRTKVWAHEFGLKSQKNPKPSGFCLHWELQKGKFFYKTDLYFHFS